MKARLIAAFAASLLALSGTAVQAQDAAAAPAPAAAGTSRGPGGIRDLSPQERPQNLSALFYMPWWPGIGAAGMIRYEIPIVKDGFIPAINDQFSLEPALGFGWQRGYGSYDSLCRDRGTCKDIYGDRVTVTPALYGVWSFHITSNFRPYGAIGVGADIGIDSDNDWLDNNSNVFIDVAAGLFYSFAKSFALRAEVGWGGPKVGLSYSL